MSRWLFKQEPECYSFADLERDGETLWDGVTNALALKHLRLCQPGDVAFFYHTGKEKNVVGILEIIGTALPDPNAENDKLVIVPVKAVRALAKPVSLAAIKADPLFAQWELVCNSRLSVMPCPEELWNRVLELAGEQPAILPSAPRVPKTPTALREPKTKKPR